ncbi:MAG: hypothetical protein EA356_02220 [Geminicoccaceae bacterium]|nr:MAG: hypothetical protein EA356_02220 [Geminicoccaceae bacterium]
MTTGRTFVATVTVTAWPQSGVGFGFAEIVDGPHVGDQISIKAAVVERLTAERGWHATSLGRTCQARLGPNPGRRPDAPPWQLLDIAETTFAEAAPAPGLFGLAEASQPYGETVAHPHQPDLAERVARLEAQVRDLQDAIYHHRHDHRD